MLRTTRLKYRYAWLWLGTLPYAKQLPLKILFKLFVKFTLGNLCLNTYIIALEIHNTRRYVMLKVIITSNAQREFTYIIVSKYYCI